MKRLFSRLQKIAALLLLGSTLVSAAQASNLFQESLGKTDAETKERIEAAWRQLTQGDKETERLYYEAPEETAYIADTGNGDVRSEGMSYGMMIAVQLDRQEEFNRLWKWAHTHMRHADGPRRGYFAWQCDFDGRKIDPGTASDGEEWIAMSLLFAANRWGDGEGIFNYSAEAQALLREMRLKKATPEVTPIFDAEHRQVVFSPDPKANQITDPSYHLPAFYELWARWDEDPEGRAFWKSCAEESREFFRRAAHPETGFMPEYSHFDGKPYTQDTFGIEKDVFGFDAWRTLAHVAIDHAWGSGDAWQVQQSNRALKFLSTLPQPLVNRYTLDGKPLEIDASAGLLAMAAAAGVSADPEVAKPFIAQLWDAPLPTGKWRYYHGLLHMLALLQVSGHLQIHEPPVASLGLSNNIIRETAGGFPLVISGAEAPLWHDAADHKGVIRAIGDLQADIERVTGRKPSITTNPPGSKTPVIIGTLGKSALIDRLVKEGKLNAADLTGKWESFVITTVSQPAPGIDQALVIAGSDKRGTIFGIYELSEQLGFSPWYWWADVPVEKRKEAYVVPGRFASGEPVVKYRGIFINDEEPALGPWAYEKFGGVNSKMYSHMFELILRLRGNYLWPAMWGKAFNEDDPENPRLADEYGIVMGTSHHEPMMRAQEEWTKRKAGIGNGEWNYHTNQKGLWNFWQEGIERNKNYENLVTIGMRGDGDEPMDEGGNMKANIALLERIVADQRKLIAAAVNPDVTQVPQLWTLYKEVADYYSQGMKVPDDVTLLWCDDNWGNIRRLPTPAERKRSGGAGIYYHFDYVGSPRSYKWLNTNPLPKIWEQMNMAHEYDANRVWVVNVGDLKPMELPIEFFLRMAWNPKALPKEKIADFTRRWAEREFGKEHASEIADIVSKAAKYSAWRKPELLEPTTFSLTNYQEAERVLAAWQAITREAERINALLPSEFRDAFYQLVLYPAKAAGAVVELHIETGRNHLHAAQGRATANERAARVRELFKQDQDLSDAYHQLAGGKWNHMMAQTRIGYTSWKDPETNIMPKLVEVTPVSGASIGVSIEGSESAWPGGTGTPKLPPFDSINQQTRWIDVFRRGSESFAFSISANQPWVKFSTTSGTVAQDQRVMVSIDWEKIPVGSQGAVITVSRSGGENVGVHLTALRSEQFTRENVKAAGGLTGPTVIPAESASANIAAGGVRWETIPDYGRGRSGMSIFPTTAASVQPPDNSPCLEYTVFIPKAGEVRVDLIAGSSLNVQPDRGLRLAVSFNDQAPQIIDAFAGQFYADPSKRPDLSSPAIKDWANWVRDNARTLKSTHKIAALGTHTLKVWMVDPGLVLESLIIHDGNLPKSYFGPPESR